MFRNKRVSMRDFLFFFLLSHSRSISLARSQTQQQCLFRYKQKVLNFHTYRVVCLIQNDSNVRNRFTVNGQPFTIRNSPLTHKNKIQFCNKNTIYLFQKNSFSQSNSINSVTDFWKRKKKVKMWFVNGKIQHTAVKWALFLKKSIRVRLKWLFYDAPICICFREIDWRCDSKNFVILRRRCPLRDLSNGRESASVKTRRTAVHTSRPLSIC